MTRMLRKEKAMPSNVEQLLLQTVEYEKTATASLIAEAKKKEKKKLDPKAKAHNKKEEKKKKKSSLNVALLSFAQEVEQSEE